MLSQVRSLLLLVLCDFLTLFCPTHLHLKLICVEIVISLATSYILIVVSSPSLSLEGIQVRSSSTESNQMPLHIPALP